MRAAALAGLLACPSCGPGAEERGIAEAPDEPAIDVVRDDEGVVQAVEVTGLAATTLARLEGLSPQQWPPVLTVHTAQAANDPDAPAVLGSYGVEAGRARFTPRFPFVAGIDYRARYTPQAGAPIEATFSVPATNDPGATFVSAVFPSAPVWPMNQLKMYVHFSAPMRTDRTFDHIRVIDERNGEPVLQPFVTVQEELWNRDRTILTVLFDPARIKRGLVPHEQAGLPLQEGGRYRLEIDAALRDQEGRRLRRGYSRAFAVGPVDRASPHPSGWRLTTPRPGTRDPLRVEFDEPLDRGLLHTLLSVRRGEQSDASTGWRTTSATADDDEVDGMIETTADESIWLFTPEEPWSAGGYELVVPTILEDLAGNNLRTLFDVDLGDARSELADVETIYVPFRVSAR